MANLLNPRMESITTYDFNDFAAGTGYQRYYGSAISGAPIDKSNYKLTDYSIYGNEISTQISGASSSGWKILQTKNFDVKMNKPQVVEGDVIIQVSTGIKNTNANNDVKKTYLIATFAISGVSAITDVASGTSMIHGADTDLTSQTITSKHHTFMITVPRTKIKSGEYLRLKIDQQTYCPNNRDATWGFGTDPADRNDADDFPHIKIINDADPTTFIVDIPYRLSV